VILVAALQDLAEMRIDHGGAMSAEDPPAGDSTEAADHLRGLDDQGLLTALQEMLGQHGTAPGWSVQLAKGSYGLRAIDTELAALTSDSELDTTRSRLRADGGPRLVVFDAAALSVEVEIEPANRAERWQLIGQLIPAGPARIQLRRAPQAEPSWVDADERGRFAAGDLVSGPLSLICVRQGQPAAATAWITIG
jgi:hypothetical protein